MKQLLQHITSHNKLQLLEYKPLSGGDINNVFLLKCDEGNFVIKLNTASAFPGMFEVEAKGLRLLKQSGSFKIPNVVADGVFQNSSYLILEYIAVGTKSHNFWELFAENLSKLHKTSSKQFGLDHNNFIGSLPQKNEFESIASDFYISQRLDPQFKLASEKGYKFKNLTDFYKNISAEIPNEPPSLIHGDLWGGNYLVSENGNPVLIDPALAFAPREMDLAMMKLFGGFSEEVFSNYNDILPLAHGWKDRVPLWQLYYLLVHLNIFGSGYLQQVKAIMKPFL